MLREHASGCKLSFLTPRLATIHSLDVARDSRLELDDICYQRSTRALDVVLVVPFAMVLLSRCVFVEQFSRVLR